MTFQVFCGNFLFGCPSLAPINHFSSKVIGIETYLNSNGSSKTLPPFFQMNYPVAWRPSVRKMNTTEAFQLLCPSAYGKKYSITELVGKGKVAHKPRRLTWPELILVTVA